MDKEKLLLARVSDKIKQYKKSGEIAFTSFLDPAEQVECEGILRGIPNIFWGGYDGAERKIAIIGIDIAREENSHWGLSPTEVFCSFGTDDTNSAENLPIVAVMITSNAPLSHRSVLGSILGLGITREKVGDIIVNENTCDVIAMSSLKDFILNNLNYVGREKVKVKEIDLDELVISEKEIKEINTTVASLRLDAILSSSLSISREKSSSLIESERVNVNYKLVTSVKKQITEGDLISVRGYGRIVVAEVIGESRSGRVKIKINKL